MVSSDMFLPFNGRSATCLAVTGRSFRASSVVTGPDAAVTSTTSETDGTCGAGAGLVGAAPPTAPTAAPTAASLLAALGSICPRAIAFAAGAAAEYASCNSLSRLDSRPAGVGFFSAWFAAAIAGAGVACLATIVSAGCVTVPAGCCLASGAEFGFPGWISKMPPATAIPAARAAQRNPGQANQNRRPPASRRVWLAAEAVDSLSSADTG